MMTALSIAILLLFIQTTLSFIPLPPGLSSPKWNTPDLREVACRETADPNNQKKKKKKLVLNPNLSQVASISSEGVLANKARMVERPNKSSRLGVPSSKNKEQQPFVGRKAENKPLSKKERQRTANGAIDSSVESNTEPALQNVQVLVGKRGNKTVTIVRGLVCAAEEKKRLLKAFKSKLGVGGTIVEGVLEIQGSHVDKVVEMLSAQGYKKAKKIGK